MIWNFCNAEKMMRAIAVLTVMITLAFCSSILMAQSQANAGEIAGTVKDASGAVIPAANVEAVNLATGLTQTATTNPDGNYRIVLLPPGAYKVTVKATGFAESRGEIQVGVGRTADLNLAMGVAGLKEQVTVTPDLLETTRHEEAAFVGATVVQNIPLNGRRFQDIVTTTPTAAIDPSRGGITMTGQRMVNTGSINVDGADYGQLFFGGIRGGERAGFAPTIPLDSIQEFQIVRAGYTAEFGRSTGGAITAITKSGTNNFHGSAGYVIRPDSLAAGNEFYDTVKGQLVSSGCTTCVVNPNPTLQQWGGTIGGPIKKDKLFVFGAYDQQRQRLPHQVFFSNIATFTPTAATQEAYNQYKSLEAPFQQTNDAWLFLAKVDYNFSQHHRLSVRYNHSNYTGENATSVGTALAPTLSNALSNNGTEIDKTRTLVGQLTSFGSNIANEFRTQYAYEQRPRLANAQSPTISNNVGNYGTVSFLGQNEEHDYRLQFSDNVTWIKGNHTVKFGGEFNHLLAAQTFGFNQYGQFNSTTSDITTILRVMGVRWDDTTALYSHQIGNLAATLPGQQFAAFVQDSWRIRPNFTVNYGLRWEAALNPTPEANNAMVAQVQGVTFPDGLTEDPTKIPNQTKQFAPRLGFAWDPFKDGKTVVRGFGGIYYAATPMLLYAGSENNFREPPGDVSIQFPLTVPTGVTVPGCPSPCNTVYKQLLIAGVDLKKFPLDQLPNPTVDQIRQIAGAILTAQGKAFNPFNGAQPVLTAGNFANPRSYQAGGGVERQIASGLTVGLEGTWIKTVNLQRDRDINIPFSPCSDVAGRPLYRLTGAAPSGSNCPATLLSSSQLLPRPVSSLGQVVIRESTAKALYRAMTLRSSLHRKWGEINAYYTLSENLDDDYQERSASGVQYLDAFNLAPDYNFSDLDRKHQFVAQPVFFLPYSIDISSALRIVSGAPIDVRTGSDLNQDRTNNDRPYSAVGAPFKRNAFRNLGQTNVDLRVQKSFHIRESKQIKFSAEFFNLFNLMNLTYSGSKVTNFCTSTSVVTCGIPNFQGAATNGWTANPTFLQLRDSTNTLLTNNNAPAPFQSQFSVRFVF